MFLESWIVGRDALRQTALAEQKVSLFIRHFRVCRNAVDLFDECVLCLIAFLKIIKGHADFPFRKRGCRINIVRFYAGRWHHQIPGGENACEEMVSFQCLLFDDVANQCFRQFFRRRVFLVFVVKNEIAILVQRDPNLPMSVAFFGVVNIRCDKFMAIQCCAGRVALY